MEDGNQQTSALLVLAGGSKIGDQMLLSFCRQLSADAQVCQDSRRQQTLHSWGGTALSTLMAASYHQVQII